MRIAIGVLAVLLGTSAARAEWMNGDHLFRACNLESSAGNALVMGYIQGIEDASSVPTNIEGPRYCLPDNTNSGQLKNLICAWLRANPGRRHLKGSDVVKQTLTETWPCM